MQENIIKIHRKVSEGGTQLQGNTVTLAKL